MTRPEATIELGEMNHARGPEQPGSWPLRDRLRRWRDRVGRGRRVITVIALAGLAIAVLTSAAAPAQPALSPVFTVAGISYTVDDDRMYVIDRDTRGGSLTAYRLLDGVMAWQIPIRDDSNRHVVTIIDDVLLLIEWRYTDENDPNHEQASINAIDGDSGAELWSTIGLVHGQYGAGILVERYLTGAESTINGPPFGLRLQLLEPLTGEPSWTVPLAHQDQFALTEDGTVLVIAAGDQLVSYRPDTGDQLAAAPPTTHLLWSLSVSHGMVLVGHLVDRWRDGEPMPSIAITAYDLATLQPRWTVATEPTSSLHPAYPLASRCGDLLCLTAGTRVPEAVDPATGAQVWTADWLSSEATDVEATDAVPPDPALGYLLSEFGTPESGWLLLTASGRTDRQWLVSAATGKPLLPLIGWRPISGSPSDLSAPRLMTTEPGAALGLQPRSIGQLRPDLTGIDPLGEVPHRGACTDQRPYLVCADRQPTVHGSVEVAVWRLRR